MKKNIFLLLSACLLCAGQAMGGNVLTVNDVDVPQGGQATIEIGCEFDTEYTAFELQLSLPDGLSLQADEDGYPVIEKAFDTNHILTGNLLPSNGNYKITCRSMDNISMPNSGVLFRVIVLADAGLDLGTSLSASITACEFTRTADSNGENLADVDFTVNITEFRTVLDENSTAVPSAETNANIRVRRTIKADEWSTICLPFAMTAEQMKEAFGNDVQLGDFSDTQSTYDDNDNVASISISFDDATEIEANHPYIIKVSSPITEFTVDNVDIDPAEDDALIEVDNGLTGRRRVVYGGFYGTYHAQTTLEEFSLFLSDNQFWYSTGKTKMKAFRAYFVMADVLTDVENAAARIGITFDDLTTGIRSVKGEKRGKDDAFYNLNGQRVKTLRQGLYIRNGKKIVKREKGGEQ